MRWFRHASRGIIANGLEFLAFGVIVYGCWQVWHPAAWLVGGALGAFYYAPMLERRDEVSE